MRSALASRWGLLQLSQSWHSSACTQQLKHLQGVLSVQPYKQELLPHWRFKTPTEARESSAKILEMFRTYQGAQDFVGQDMARKFLQASPACWQNRLCGMAGNGHWQGALALSLSQAAILWWLWGAVKHRVHSSQL